MTQGVKIQTRQVYNLFQDLWNRFPYFEGWGVGAKSLSVKVGQTERQTQTDTEHTGLTARNPCIENLWDLSKHRKWKVVHLV